MAFFYFAGLMNGLKVIIFLWMMGVGIAFADQAQTSDIRHKAENLPDDSVRKISLLIDAANRLQQDRPSESRELAFHALKLAYKHQRTDELDVIYRLLGSLYAADANKDSAVWFYRSALAASPPDKDPVSYGKTQNEYGLMLENSGDLTGAYRCYLNALKVFEKHNDQRGMTGEYLNIGLIHHARNDFKVARFYFIKALSLSRANHYDDLEASALNNLGMVFKSTAEYYRALDYFKQVLELDIKSGDKQNIAYSLNNVGSVYYDLKHYSEALDYFLRSATIKEELKDYPSLINTLGNIGGVYAEQKQLSRALNYLNKAEHLAIVHGFPNYLEQTYYNYHLAYKNTGDFRRALENYVRYDMIDDSLKLREKDVEIEKLQKQYDLEKASHEIEAKTEQLAKQRTYLIMGIVISCLFILISGFLMYSVNRIRKLNHKLQRHQEEIEKHIELLKQKNIDIAKAKQQAEDAAKSKGQFLSVMSHEIRTPLNAIIGVTNLLNDSEMNAENKKIIHILKTSSDNLMALINDILDVSKIESGKLHLEYVDFSLKEVVNGLHDLFMHKAKEKGLELKLEYDPALNNKMLGDPLRINQILSNLIGNAIKFTAKGSIRTLVRKAGEGKDYIDVFFSVLDTGIGIPADKQHTVFESFEQADKKTTRLYGGTGLGLSISKQLLQLLGSDLLLKSREGEGSDFYFTIRFNKIHPDAEPGEMTERDILSKLEGKRILVAEDNPVNIYILKQFLGKWKMQVKVAEDGNEAVELAVNYNFDIVLMDINMPVIDGYEASRRILAAKPDMPVIAITATTLSETTELMKQSGIIDYVPKPFQPNELVQKILTNLKDADIS